MTTIGKRYGSNGRIVFTLSKSPRAKLKGAVETVKLVEPNQGSESFVLLVMRNLARAGIPLWVKGRTTPCKGHGMTCASWQPWCGRSLSLGAFLAVRALPSVEGLSWAIRSFLSGCPIQTHGHIESVQPHPFSPRNPLRPA